MDILRGRGSGTQPDSERKYFLPILIQAGLHGRPADLPTESYSRMTLATWSLTRLFAGGAGNAGLGSIGQGKYDISNTTMVRDPSPPISALCASREGYHSQKLTKSSGLSAKYTGRLEGGKQSPTLTTVASLADALSIEPSELIAAPIPLDRLVNLASG